MGTRWVLRGFWWENFQEGRFVCGWGGKIGKGLKKSDRNKWLAVVTTVMNIWVT
jgi:hypothetical protein